MKKSLLTILGVSALATLSFAQDDTTYFDAWYNNLNEKFTVKVDPSNCVLGLTGLLEEGVNWKASSDKATSNNITFGNGKMTIVTKRLSGDANYTDITLVTTDWVGGSEIKFGEGADTLAGFFVDLDGDLVVQATLQTDVDCDVRLDIVDINGHNGNSCSQRVTVTAGAAKNYQFDFTNPDNNPYGGKLFDFYGGDFYGVANGRYATSQLQFSEAVTDLVTLKAQDFVPVRTDGINRLSFTVNDALQGEEGTPITVEMTNLTIGNVSKAVNFVPYSQENVDAGKISFNPEKVVKATYIDKDGNGTVIKATPVNSVASSTLEVYPNPAKGSINVNEFATITTELGIATGISGEGVLDITSLTHGIYYVVSTTGSVKLIVE